MRTIDDLGSLRDEGTALAAAARKELDPPVPAALAADGVAELLEVFLAPHSEGEAVGGRGETLERTGDPALLPLVRELAAAATQ